MSWILVILIAVLSYIVLLKLPKRARLLHKLRVFNGPPALPLVGNALEFSSGRKSNLKDTL